MNGSLEHPNFLRALVGVTVCLVALQAAVAPLWDADLWWILRAGEDTLRERAVPRLNRYSFTAPGHPWVMHEWLLGVTAASLRRALGLPGLALLRIGAVLVVAVFAWRTASRGARPLVAATLVAALFALFGGRFESARPIGLAYAPAMVLAWSAFAPRQHPRHILAALLGTALWTNAHGSFPLALVTLAAGAVEHRTQRHLATLLACAAVTLLNPYGPRVHDLVARYLDGASHDAVSVVHARIVEWWPLHRAPLRMYEPQELLAFGVVAALWLRALRTAQWRPRALFGLALCAMALRHQRHLQLAGLLSLPLLTPTLGTTTTRGPSMAVPWSIACAIALTAWGIAQQAWPERVWVDRSRDPADFADLHRALPSDARLFTILPFAGYAVSLGGPRVFFDTRNDCYPVEVLREALDLHEGLLTPDKVAKVLRARGATHAIAWCDSRTGRSLARWHVLRRQGGLCLWAP